MGQEAARLNEDPHAVNATPPDGGTPTDFAWPVFVVGMAIGVGAATLILRSAAPADAER